jgi:hypothetical protein
MKKILIVVLGIFTIMAGSCKSSKYESHNGYPNNSQTHSFARVHEPTGKHDRLSKKEMDYFPKVGRDREYYGWNKKI